MSARTAEAGQNHVTAGGRGQVTDWPGRIFRLLTVLPALVAMAWLLAGLPLLLAGHFTPLLTGIIAGTLAVALVILAFRWIAGPAQGLLSQRGAAPARTPWWVIAAVVAVAVAFGIDQLAYHSEQIIVSRDPASYAQFGYWIARHGSLPIPADGSAFGGYSPAIYFHSPAFYQVGHTIVPQFMAGLPMMLAPALWLGGMTAATAMGALLGTSGVLVAGGLTGRLVGPRWAPLGALVLALSLPEQFTSRSTYSEPLAQLLFLGGLCLIIDSYSADDGVRTRLAALGGLSLGLTLLVRIDGLSNLLPLIPFCGLLVLSRAGQAWPMIGGIIVGTGYGAIDGIILSRPYLSSIKSSLVPLLLIGAVVFAVTALTVMFRWDAGHPRLRTDRLPAAAAALACLATIVLIIRPYVQTTRAPVSHAAAHAIASWQLAEHLPVDPERQYYELSVHWVFWYLGVPAVVLATVGAAVLIRRCLRSEAPAWTLALMSFGWIIVTVLYRPGILPDQPWASRRLVPGVLPGVIVLALWATSWLAGLLRRRGADSALRAAVVVILAAGLIIPPAVTTWGVSLRPGPAGVQLVANGLGDQVAFGGEVAAVEKMCAEIPPDSSVLLAGGIQDLFAQDVRGMCGLPSATVSNPSPARVRLLVAAIQRAGRRPVLLGPSPDWLAGYGIGKPRHVLGLINYGDAHNLVSPPVRGTPQRTDVWMSEFPK